MILVRHKRNDRNGRDTRAEIRLAQGRETTPLQGTLSRLDADLVSAAPPAKHVIVLISNWWAGVASVAACMHHRAASHYVVHYAASYRIVAYPDSGDPRHPLVL